LHQGFAETDAKTINADLIECIEFIASQRD
jgi:hypothetical protein